MSDDVLDLDEFKDRVQDDTELLLELLDIYTADFKEKRPKFDQILQSGNADELRSLAHSLKGASGNISAKLLRETFFQLEEKGKSGNISGADELLKVVDERYAALEERITSVKQELA